MIINGLEIAFDMDVRSDYSKFAKALEGVTQKKLDFDGMEAFLRDTLPGEAVDLLLQDGRISTLTKTFTDFFDAGLNQLLATENVYHEAANTIQGMEKRASVFAARLESAAGGGYAAERNTVGDDHIQPN